MNTSKPGQRHRGRVGFVFRLVLLVGVLGVTTWAGLRRDRLTAAEAAFARGDRQNAIRLALDDLRVYPWSRSASLIAARVLSLEVLPAEAEPYYKTAQRFGKLPLAAQQDRIQGFVRALKNEEAVNLSHLVLKDHPNDPVTLRYLATVEWAQGRLPEAREAAQKLSETEEGQIDGLDLLATIEREAEQKDRAIAACEAILEIDPQLKRYRPGAANFWKEFADDLVVRKRSAEARDYLLKQITPWSDPILLDILGAAQKDLGDIKGAERSWRESIRRDPKHMNPYLRLGNLLLPQKRFAEAIELLEKAVAIAPDFLDANNQLAHAYRVAGHDADADRYTKKTEELRKVAPPKPKGGMRPSS